MKFKQNRPNKRSKRYGVSDTGYDKLDGTIQKEVERMLILLVKYFMIKLKKSRRRKCSICSDVHVHSALYVYFSFCKIYVYRTYFSLKVYIYCSFYLKLI